MTPSTQAISPLRQRMDCRGCGQGDLVVEQKLAIELAENRKQAIRLALSSKVLVITGGPGVGKTTLVNSILTILRAKQVKALLCAPTREGCQTLAGIHRS